MENIMTKQEMIDYFKNEDLSELIRTGEAVELTPLPARKVTAARTACLQASVRDEILRVAEEQEQDERLMRQIMKRYES